MPSLLPPPEFRPGELSKLGLTGTCELQICRSAGVWSLGTPDRIELSIQNAYLKGTAPIYLLLQTFHPLSRSHPDVGSLRLHRESILHYIVSPRYVLRGCISAQLCYRTVVNEVKIENKVGDALVHRIIRAHKEGTPFKVCVVIPLLPGFTFPVDHSDASAVSLLA